MPRKRKAIEQPSARSFPLCPTIASSSGPPAQHIRRRKRIRYDPKERQFGSDQQELGQLQSPAFQLGAIPSIDNRDDEYMPFPDLSEVENLSQSLELDPFKQLDTDMVSYIHVA